MKSNRRKFPLSYQEIQINLNRLYLKASFKCKIKAVVQSNCDKQSSNTVQFSVNQGQAIFQESIIVYSNPSLDQTLKLTTLIVKKNTTKMVGVVKINLNNDPIRLSGSDKYVLEKCPMPGVKLQFQYEFTEQDIFSKQIP
jgi:hypothetical protein